MGGTREKEADSCPQSHLDLLTLGLCNWPGLGAQVNWKVAKLRVGQGLEASKDCQEDPPGVENWLG